MSWDTEVLHEPLAQATGCRLGAKTLGLAALGGKVRDARLERIRDSIHFVGERFVNTVETTLSAPSAGLAWEYVAGGRDRVPREPFPIVSRDAIDPIVGRGEALRITWLGHSTVLLEIDGALVLTDPVFGPRAAPVSWMGPKRFHPVPIEPEQLPPTSTS